MYTDDYEKLHQAYIAKMVEYHNAYHAYMYGARSKPKNFAMRVVLKELLKLNKALIAESIAVRKKKIEAYSDTYQGQRKNSGDASRFYKNDVDTSGDNS
jgi:hypothetical protein